MKIEYQKEEECFVVEGYIIDAVNFNFICCSLFRIQDEIEYQMKNEFEYNNIDVFENDNGKIKIVAKTKNGKVIIKINNMHKSITYDELIGINNQLYNKLNQAYNLKYNIKKFDPVFLSLFLWKRLHKISEIKLENIYLDNLRVPKGKKDVENIKDTLFYKTLKTGKKIFIPSKFKSNHKNEEHYYRILNIDKSVRKNGYPYNEQYIILYNDENIIRDGQHRACSLKHLYGNISVPVMRIFFKR